MTDIITIFNRLTNSRLADCTLFEEVLNEHYDKFKYFYHIINNIPLIKVDKIMCSIEREELIFQIELTSVGESVSYEMIFREYLDNFTDKYYTKYFICSLFLDNESIYLSIHNNEKFKNEFSIYEDRFNNF